MNNKETAMKKFILLLAVMLFCFAAAIAQAQDTELNLNTIGNLFSWSDTSEDVLEFLSQFDDLLTGQEDDKKIHSTRAAEDSILYFIFYFDSKSDLLERVESVAIYYDDDAAIPAAAKVIEAYDLTSVEPYEDDFTAGYVAEMDGSMTVAGPETICVVGGTDAKADSFGFVTLLFMARS